MKFVHRGVGPMDYDWIEFDWIVLDWVRPDVGLAGFVVPGAGHVYRRGYDDVKYFVQYVDLLSSPSFKYPGWMYGIVFSSAPMIR